MKKKAIFTRFILIIICVMSFAAGMLFIRTSEASAVGIEYTEEALKDYYTLGDTFVCPAAKINVDGTRLDVKKHALYYPDGNAFSDGQYVLSNPGEYVLRYYADYNGKTVFAEDSFAVKGVLYNVSSSMSSVSYGNTGAEKGNLDGLKVSLTSGDVFTYNKPLDLKDKKKADTLISFFILPANKGIADVQDVKVRLTDVADETNFIEFATFAHSADENEYSGDALPSAVRTSINKNYVGLHYKGYAADKTGYTYYDGSYYTIYKDVSYTSRYGYPSYAASFAACVGYGYDVDYSKATSQQNGNFNKPFSYAIDYEEKIAYGYEQGRGSWGPDNRIIADLDDLLFFDNLWTGFTTGEAYLSVYSDMYVNSTFDFVILNIFDEDLEATDFEYVGEPVIKVEFPQGEMPYAIKDEAYRVFDAKAYSGCDGEIECKTLVYKDYDSDSPKLCPVVGGAFTPTDEKSSYTIVYSAVDSFGNSVEKLVDISVKATREASLSLVGGDDTAYTGETIILKQPVCEKTNGSYTVSVVASIDNESYPITVSGDGIYRFYTLKAGDYDVKYTLTDYNSPIEEDYVLTVAENPNSVFYGEPVLPRALVKGVKYEFPVQYGKSFFGGEVNDLTATLKYSFDDGEPQSYGGTPVRITADTNVKLIYSLEGAVSDCVFEIPVVDVGLATGKFKREKYFYSEQFTGTAEEKSVRYSTTAESAELSYVKPVLTTDCLLEYKLLTDNFSSITFTLRDATDSTNVLKIVMTKKDSSKFLVSVNGSANKEIMSSALEVVHKITYNSALNTLKIDDFDFNVAGVKDFARKNAYFDIAVNGIEGEFRIDILTFGNQKFNKKTSDNTSPLFYLDVNDGKKVKGEKIIIKGLFIEDLLSFATSGTITVKDPNGSICRTVDGVLMNEVSDFTRVYEISADVYGTYTIFYECFDDYGNLDDKTVKISVYSSALPTVRISDTDKYPAVYSGRTYKIAKATAVDIMGNDINVLTVVIDTEGKTHVIENSEFEFKRAGIYKVMYYAEDSLGNIGFASYDIIAVDKEGK